MSLDLKFTVKNVTLNRSLIDERIAEIKAELAACEGLHKANQSVCPHKRKRDVYDPGYAGGGHDGYKCEDCGRRGHF